MKIFNEDKTQEFIKEQINFDNGYLKPDKKFVMHHEAVEGKFAVYDTVTKKLTNGSTETYHPLKVPAIKAKEAYDEYEDIQVYVPFTAEQKKEHLRRKRESECFTIINRGQYWYDMLTETQKTELKEWYIFWLNVTETLVVPQKPEWLK